MTANGWFQIGVFLLAVFAVTKPLGIFITRVFNREKTLLDPVLRPVEKLVYRLAGTPEYLGKKIEAYDVKMAMLAVLVLSFTILAFSAFAAVEKFGISSISNPGPHGLSQILSAYTSAAGNNGSAFGGLNANTLWYNTSMAAAMLLGRFFMVIPILAIAGNLARKKLTPQSVGTFPVNGPLLTLLLISTILIVGSLTFFPALSLGPILEHLLRYAGKVFWGPYGGKGKPKNKIARGCANPSPGGAGFVRQTSSTDDDQESLAPTLKPLRIVSKSSDSASITTGAERLSRRRPNELRQFQSVQMRHAHVQKNAVEPFPFQALGRFAAVVHCPDLALQRLQHSLDRFQDVRLIVNHHDLKRHGAVLSPRVGCE
jgi:hypothetical protein